MGRIRKYRFFQNFGTDVWALVKTVIPRDPTQMPGTTKTFFIEINTFIEKQKYPLIET